MNEENRCHDMMSRQTLPKEQRLHKKKEIEQLFEKGKGFNFYPFRVVVYLHDTEENNSIPRLLVSVSKKRFHHAVKRNKVKRLVREAWRKNKTQLMIRCDEQKKILDVALVYTATIILSYEEIEKKIKQLSLRLENSYL
ncbi:MAG: ribonuclease P protein component [Lentimicrobiaceae bacterium]|nr:ribonuclease P protein component [Lentimicrobiaceae bacterium]